MVEYLFGIGEVLFLNFGIVEEENEKEEKEFLLLGFNHLGFLVY